MFRVSDLPVVLETQIYTLNLLIISPHFIKQFIINIFFGLQHKSEKHPVLLQKNLINSPFFLNLSIRDEYLLLDLCDILLTDNNTKQQRHRHNILGNYTLGLSHREINGLYEAK